MKKNLFYLVLSAGVLASCSQDEGTDNAEHSLVPSADHIVISAASPSIAVSASTRSLGSVGADGSTISNQWDGQTLHMFAFEKDATTGVTKNDRMSREYSPLYDQTAVVASGVSSSLKWPTAYFPRTGAYDFFGYYADDAATASASVENLSGTNVCQIPFTIDGSQDLMIAKAALRAEDKAKLDAADYNKAYSSYTARKEVQPYMKFQHLLTRLVFKIKGMGSSKPEEVYVRSIKVKSKNTGKLVFAYTVDGNKGIKWSPTGTEQFLSLQERTTINGKSVMQTLDKARWDSKFNLYEKNTNGTYKYQDKSSLAGDLKTILGKYNASATGADANVVGEALLVNPDVTQYSIEVEVIQYYDEDGDLIPVESGTEFTAADKRCWTYPLTLNAKDVTETGTSKPASITQFAASSSYNVTIAVYGLQKMDITAELGEWKQGGDIIVNPDDKY